MDERDFVQIAVGTHDGGMTTEAIGRVLWSEDEKAGQNSQNRQAARDNLPIVQRKIEMAQKRAETRLRDMVFGPPTKLAQFRGRVLIEGLHDDPNTVEGQARIIEDEALPAPAETHGPASDQNPLPAMGSCTIHGVQWSVREQYGKIMASHAPENQGEKWCQLGQVYAPLLAQAWGQKWPGDLESDGILTKDGKANINTWVKNTFNGKTWSKLDAPEQVRAVSLLVPVQNSPEGNGDDPFSGEPTETPPPEQTPLKSSQGAAEGQPPMTPEQNAEMDLEIAREQQQQ